MIRAIIKDAHGGLGETRVTSRGELVVAREYSDAYTASATVINTGYNYSSIHNGNIEPRAGKRFVITDLLISCDRNVGATSGAIINVYETDSPTGLNSVGDIIKDIEIIKNERFAKSLNMLLAEGVWLNIKTDDNNVTSTIWGYYIDA